MSKSKRESKKIKLSKNLTPDQIMNYKRMGVPDLSQDWLELFTDELVSDLFTIMRSCSDNQKKAEYIENELAQLGFQVVGEGTNILVLSNPVYPGVVFKIALDDNGIADNFNDDILQDIVPHYVPVFARHPSAIVSVQQRGVKPTPEQMSRYRPKILALLGDLSKYFLIADLSPDMFLNYVVDRDGDFLICDGSDLYPLHQIKDPIRCKSIVGEHHRTGEFKYCEGKLKYSEDYKWLICEKCGKMYNPLEMRPKKEVKKLYKVMCDGFSVEEQRMLESEELSVVAQELGITPDTDHDDEGPNEVSMEDLIRSDKFDVSPRPFFTNAESDTDTDEDEGLESFDSDEDEDDDSVEVNDAEDSEDDEDANGRVHYVGLDDTDDGEEPDVPEDITRVEFDHNVAPVESGPEKVDSNMNTIDGGEPEEEATVESESRVVVIETNPAISASIDPVEILANLKRRDIFKFSEMVNAIMSLAGISASHEVAISDDDKQRPVDIVISQLKDEALFGEDLEDLYSAVQNAHGGTVVTNESSNSYIPGASAEPNGSHIRYQVVEEDGEESTTAGIYLTITGNFDEAYDEYGLPLFISVDNGAVFKRAISANELKALMSPAIASAIEEFYEDSASNPVTDAE